VAGDGVSAVEISDPNLEWLGHVQPVGLVVAPKVLRDLGQNPATQTRVDTAAVAQHLTEQGASLRDPWTFVQSVLGWLGSQVAGSPDWPAVPDELSAWLPESETRLAPHWAVADPDGGWQLLVRLEGVGIEPDRRGALEGWEATPHQRLERLLRETGVPAGLLLTDNELRLVHAPRGETSGWLRFPLRPLGAVSGRPMLGGLKLLLGGFRLHNAATDIRLPGLLRASRAAQAAVSATLSTQVLGALHELLRGLHAAEPDRIAALAGSKPQHLYEGLLTVMLRLVFLLYAEDRDLIPSQADAAARAFYDQGYGVRTLHARLLDDQARNPDTMEERRGAWGQLLALFRLVHQGDGTSWIRGRGGKLFDPALFPFLMGQDVAEDPPQVPHISDGCVLEVLNGLLVLDGERLSYRTLDVEQIGSVYETVMGFDIARLPGRAVAVRARKNQRARHATPVFVDLDALLKMSAKDRVKFLREDCDCKDLSEKRQKPVAEAKTLAELVDAIRSVMDERGSPHGQIAPAGTPLLQPTDERRRSGSHYTPRDLTEPIVRHALAPAFERLGADATTDAVLGLKVCDPAMGSGAFLVEACRQIATRLVAAWARHPGTRPEIAADEDEDLLARRLVAQRCLYGVDRNAMAVDLARLSLWLATLARDHEFTFLDHALKAGDSLVGLSVTQIGALNWGDTRQTSLFGRFASGRVAEAIAARAEIRDAPDDVARAIQEQRHRALEAKLDDVRTLGDAVLATFFAHAKPKAREASRAKLEDLGGGIPEMLWQEVRAKAAGLRYGPRGIRPFHWQIEFPEVFAGPEPGFDAIVGNPPFAGKNTLINGHRESYLPWLQTLHAGAHGNADVVAHFFRRAFALLRLGGCLGLIATNTVGQGDTRESGLRAVIAAGGVILRATRRLVWPGEAAVVVSVVHIRRGPVAQPVLDGRQVRRISAYLVEGDLDASPERLAANNGRAFQGAILLGLGFTFDDKNAAKGKCSPLSEMHRLIAQNPRNGERIFPYLGGEEVNGSPTHAHRRWCIDFNDFPLRREEMPKTWLEMDGSERAECRTKGVVPQDYPEPVAFDWPGLLDVVERLVKPERSKQDRDAMRVRWWQFAEKRPGLRAAIQGLPEVLVITQTSPHLAVSRIPAGSIYDQKLIVLARSDVSSFGYCQSRVHEVWARFFAATTPGDSISYGPSDCFATFPFPATAVTEAATAYHDYRASLMVARGEGLTKVYNRFHDPAERSADIVRLRALHDALDAAVLRAYGWSDLAEQVAAQHLFEDEESDHKYQGRLFWPALFRDTVLARLLALNASRAGEERRLGLAPLPAEAEEQLEEAEAE
jgi:hypothetical protein